MGKDERYAIYIYYDSTEMKMKPAPVLWYDRSAGYLRAYRSEADGLAEYAMNLMAQSAVGYIDDVVSAHDALLYGELFDFIDKKSWLAHLKQQAKTEISSKSTAIEIDLPDMGGTVVSRTGVLVSSIDLMEMLGIRNIQHPVIAALAAKVLNEPIRWHALCFKARMKNAEPYLQEELTDVVAMALAGI